MMVLNKLKIMLTKFRTKHIKPIIWIILIAVATCFILWGTPSSKQEAFQLTIGKKTISRATFQDYINTAKLYYRFSIKTDFQNKINNQQLQAKALEILTLIWKANKEGIEVLDQEVVKAIQIMFSRDGSFDKELYLRFAQEELRLSPRKFEEHIRRILVIDKVIDKYVRNNIEIDEKMILDLYKKYNEKIKFSYLLVPYKKFSKEIIITDEQINEFYNQNTARFQDPEKIKISYINIDKKTDKKLIKKITRYMKKVKDIQDLAKKFSLNLQKSAYLTAKASLSSGFWNKKTSDLAFSLPLNKISPMVELDSRFIIFEKTEKIDKKIQTIKKVKDIISKELEKKETKAKTEELAASILKSLVGKNANEFEKIAKKHNLTVNSSEFLTLNDSIKDIGKISEIFQKIKATKKGEIFKESFTISSGKCIVKLENFTPINEDKYKQEKETYKDKIWEQKVLIKHFTFLTELQKEANIKGPYQD